MFILQGREINPALLDQLGARLVSESVAHHVADLLLGEGLLLRPRGQGRHGGGTGNVGPNSVRPRPSAAGPYVLLLRPGREGKDQPRRQNEKSQRFAESHCHLARLLWTERNLWG